MQGSPSERERGKGTGASQGERNREKSMGDPTRGTNDRSRAGSQSTSDELNDEGSAGQSGGLGAGRDSDTDRNQNR